MHDEPLADAVDRYIVEQAGRQQRFQRRVARNVVEPPVGRRMEIRTHRIGVDPAITLHGDGVGRLRVSPSRNSRPREQRDRGEQ